MFERMNARLVYVLLAIAAALAFALSFLVVADVVGRAFFSRPVQGTPEMVSMSIVIICFLLAGYAVQSRSMIYTDAIVGLFGWRGHVWTAFASGVLGGTFFLFVAWGTWEPLLHSLASGEYEGEGALRVPTWPARLGVLVGASLVSLNYLVQAVASFMSLVRGIPPEKSAEQATLV